MDISDMIVLIPALKPQETLVDYVGKLVSHGPKHVLVVDDGSGPAFASLFEKIAGHGRCTVLGYPLNQGKGHALKHGIAHALAQFPDAAGIVTADADGQHTVKDVLRLADALAEQPTDLILGSRDLSGRSVPLKSQLGNRLTSLFFALLYGRWLPDTQTGLRAFSMDLADFMVGVPGSRYEYEMNVLVRCASRHIRFYLVPIETVYIGGNESSHFRPLRDSARIYWNLFRNFLGFASSSALSTVIDVVLFTVLDRFLLPAILADLSKTVLWGISLPVLLATALARLCSAFFNYGYNRSLVFKATDLKDSLARYILLCVCVMLLSATLVSFLSSLLSANRTLVKLFVDTALFFVNYRVQRSWVFRDKSTGEA